MVIINKTHQPTARAIGRKCAFGQVARSLMVAAFFIVLLQAADTTAQTDETMGGYTSMEIEAGRMVGNFATGAIEEMSGGVRIRLLADNPDMAPLPIQAEVMKFSWTQGRTTPSMIVMERKVRVAHPDATISAERAEWNFDSGQLVFSGSPEVNSERLKGLRGEQMTLNLKTNTFEVTQVRAEEVPLQTPEVAERAPQHGFRAEEVQNWERLIAAIKEQAAAEEPSPGKQILAQLSAQNQQLLMQLDTAMLVERKADMLRLINGVLTNPDFYNEAAWAEITLSDEATGLLAESERDTPKQARLNRLLLEAAYPFAFINTEQ